MKCDLHQRIADIVFFGPMHKNSDCRRGTQPDSRIQEQKQDSRQQSINADSAAGTDSEFFGGCLMNFSDKIYSK